MISLTQILADLDNKSNSRVDAAKSGNMYNVLKELQGLSVFKGAGALANTNIAIAGIVAAEDTLVSVLELTISAGNITGINDRTSTTSITSDGNIQCTVSTNTSLVLVFWYNQK